MTEKRSGAAARLKKLQPALNSFQCVCHTLALANTDANHALSLSRMRANAYVSMEVPNAQLSLFMYKGTKRTGIK